MRHLLVIFCLLTTTLTLFSMDYPPKESIKIDDTWSIAEGEHNGHPLVMRFRSKLTSLAGHPSYPKRLEITWSFRSFGENRMPSSAESEAMKVFENRLVPAVERDNLAILTTVVTNDGERIWYFYVSDVPEFGKRLTNMPQEEERYPIALSATADPNWDFYLDILKNNK